MTSSLQQRPSSWHSFPFVCSRIGHHERWFRTLSQKESMSTLDLGLIIRSFSLRVLAITTATPKAWKTSFENEHLGSCDYFAVMLPSLNFSMLVKYATTGPQGAPLVQMQSGELKNCYFMLTLSAKPQMWLFHVVVLQRTARNYA